MVGTRRICLLAPGRKGNQKVIDNSSPVTNQLSVCDTTTTYELRSWAATRLVGRWPLRCCLAKTGPVDAFVYCPAAGRKGNQRVTDNASPVTNDWRIVSKRHHESSPFLAFLRLNLQLPPEGFAELWKMTVVYVDERRRQPALPLARVLPMIDLTRALTDSKQFVERPRTPYTPSRCNVRVGRSVTGDAFVYCPAAGRKGNQRVTDNASPVTNGSSASDSSTDNGLRTTKERPSPVTDESSVSDTTTTYEQQPTELGRYAARGPLSVEE